MRWHAFAEACPEIAALAEERFRHDQLLLVGTIPEDGSPRISPNECDLAGGELFVGMMWQSRKAVDLARDPRCVLHSVPSDKDNPGGDVKLAGRAVDIRDAGLRRVYREEHLVHRSRKIGLICGDALPEAGCGDGNSEPRITFEFPRAGQRWVAAEYQE